MMVPFLLILVLLQQSIYALSLVASQYDQHPLAIIMQ